MVLFDQFFDDVYECRGQLYGFIIYVENQFFVFYVEWLLDVGGYLEMLVWVVGVMGILLVVLGGCFLLV